MNLYQQTYSKIEDGPTGPHFTDSQKEAEGYRNLSATWREECISMADGLDQLADAERTVVDYSESPLVDWEPVLHGSEVYLRNRNTEQAYKPTNYALGQLCRLGGLYGGAVCHMRAVDGFDSADGETILRVLNNSVWRDDRTDQRKPRLIRCWRDGTMRAVLSMQYRPVSNLWFLDQYRQLLTTAGRTDAILSHWRCDADTLQGNILLADTIRQDQDSEYGGLINLGNSESGNRRATGAPGLFRSICMNGLIWDLQKGQQIKQRHRGAFSLSDFRDAIAVNLQQQLPVVTDGMQTALERMQVLRERSIHAAKSTRFVAQLAKDLKFDKLEAAEIRRAWEFEREMTYITRAASGFSGWGGGDGNSQFGLLQGITRFSQKTSPTRHFEIDRLAGQFADWTGDRWSRFESDANSLTDSQVNNLVANA